MFINSYKMAYHQTFTSKSEEKDTNFAFGQDALSFFSLFLGTPISMADMKDVETQKQSTKTKMSSVINSILTNYSKSGDDNSLSMTTFRYIVHYKKTGEAVGRLSVALADFGYTRDEIDKMSLDEIIKEILSR